MNDLNNSIYKIITADGTGTGFKVENHDLVITNYHVVQGSKKVAVQVYRSCCYGKSRGRLGFFRSIRTA